MTQEAGQYTVNEFNDMTPFEVEIAATLIKDMIERRMRAREQQVQE